MAEIKYAIGRPFTQTSGREGDFLIMTNATGSADAGFSALNVLDEHMRRRWRFTTGGTAAINVITASTNPDAILIEDCNVDQVQVEATTYNLTQNERTGRWGRLIEPPDTTTSWTFTFDEADSPTNDGYVECGRICMVKNGSLKTMTRPWEQPFSWSPQTLGADRQIPGGATETTSTSDIFLEFDVQGRFEVLNAAMRSHPLAMTKTLTDQRILHWEDRDDDTNNQHAYLVRRTGNPDVTEDFPNLEVDMSMVEVI